MGLIFKIMRSFEKFEQYKKIHRRLVVSELFVIFILYRENHFT